MPQIGSILSLIFSPLLLSSSVDTLFYVWVWPGVEGCCGLGAACVRDLHLKQERACLLYCPDLQA